MSRRVFINLIFFNVVFGVMILWAVNNIVTLDRIERPYTITGDFIQAAGVKANAEVTYLGVHYGRVSGVERRPGGVSVTMKIDRDKDIPAGSIARVFRKSAIGEPYIDFIPPETYEDGDDQRIEPGENIPKDRTTVPLEFSELLRSASAAHREHRSRRRGRPRARALPRPQRARAVPPRPDHLVRHAHEHVRRAHRPARPPGREPAPGSPGCWPTTG